MTSNDFFTKQVEAAGQALLQGKTLLYPTDTIWGLGGDATRPDTVARIYQIKQREDSKSLLILLDTPERLNEYVNEIPEKARQLIKETERPLTLIYPQGKNLAPNILAQDGSIGIRLTTDPFCRALIAYTNKPLISTSANISGQKFSGGFHDVDSSIIEQADHVVEWRQEEPIQTNASKIVKIARNGTIQVLRE